MPLIERYVFRKAALSTLGAVGGLIAVMWVVRAVQEVNILVNKGQGIITYLSMISLGVPTLAAAIAPLALLIGLVRTINSMNSDSELVVLHASGASRMTLLRPFLLVSAVTAVVVLVLHVWVGPASMAKLRSFVTEVRADLVSVVIQEGRFTDVGDGMTFHIASRAPGGVLKGVFIHDTRQEGEAQTYLAEEGVVAKVRDEAFLVLENGQIQRQEDTSAKISTIRYDSYAFDLSTYGSTDAGPQSQMEVSTARLLDPDPEDPLYKSAPSRYTAELNIRLTGWLHALAVGFLVLVYLGDPISHRQGQNFVVFACCLVAIGTKAIAVTLEGAARDSVVALAMLWALPLTAIVASIVLLVLDIKAVPDSVARSAARAQRRTLDWIRLRLPFLGDVIDEPDQNAAGVA